MPVSQRGDSWQADFRHGTKRFRKSFRTQLEAVQWESAAKDRLAKGMTPEPGEHATATTLRAVTDAVIARRWKGSSNERNSTRNADEAVDFFGEDVHPAEVTAARIDEWVDSLQKRGNSPATINRKLAALSTVLRHARTRGFLAAVPHMERLKESKGRIRWYSRDEEDRIISYFRDERGDEVMVLLVQVLIDTGCRLSEALNLKWKDVDTKHVRIWKTKSNRPRSVPLTSRLRAALQASRQSPEDSVFPTLTVQIANHRWGAMRKGTGIDDKDAVIHTLRHTCASRLVQAGVGLTVVQAWLGHESFSVTQRYAHLAPDTLDSAAIVLDRVTTEPVTNGADSVRSDPIHDGVVTLVTNVSKQALAA